MPVRVSPSLRMNMAQTVTTAALLNPDSASLGETRLSTASAPSTSSATRSMRIHSVMNSTSAAPRINSTWTISIFTSGKNNASRRTGNGKSSRFFAFSRAIAAAAGGCDDQHVTGRNGDFANRG